MCGILDAVLKSTVNHGGELKKLGYQPGWKLMNASDFGVPQLRPRVVFVTVRKDMLIIFLGLNHPMLSPTVGEIVRSDGC